LVLSRCKIYEIQHSIVSAMPIQIVVKIKKARNWLLQKPPKRKIGEEE
jgi:hypothetical protein